MYTLLDIGAKNNHFQRHSEGTAYHMKVNKNIHIFNYLHFCASPNKSETWQSQPCLSP